MFLVTAILEKVFFQPPECDYYLQSSSWFALSPHYYILHNNPFLTHISQASAALEINSLPALSIDDTQIKSSICGKKIKNSKQLYYSIKIRNVLLVIERNSIRLFQKLKFVRWLTTVWVFFT